MNQHLTNSPMKKVAYIFHGHARTWDKCCDNFLNNVHSVLPGDIFIHTWDKLNAGSTSYWTPGGYSKELTEEQKELASSTPDFNSIYKKYNPKILIVQPDLPPNYDPIRDTHHIESPSTPAHLGTKNMLYQSRLIFQLADAYDDYDYFFSTRMDID